MASPGADRGNKGARALSDTLFRGALIDLHKAGRAEKVPQLEIKYPARVDTTRDPRTRPQSRVQVRRGHSEDSRAEAVDSIIKRIRRTQQIGAGVAKRGTEGETSSDDAASLLGSSSMLPRSSSAPSPRSPNPPSVSSFSTVSPLPSSVAPTTNATASSEVQPSYCPPPPISANSLVHAPPPNPVACPTPRPPSPQVWSGDLINELEAFVALAPTRVQKETRRIPSPSAVRPPAPFDPQDEFLPSKMKYKRRRPSLTLTKKVDPRRPFGGPSLRTYPRAVSPAPLHLTEARPSFRTLPFDLTPAPHSGSSDLSSLSDIDDSSELSSLSESPSPRRSRSPSLTPYTSEDMDADAPSERGKRLLPSAKAGRPLKRSKSGDESDAGSEEDESDVDGEEGSDLAEDDSSWCTCEGEVEGGEMIACDAPDCDIEWYHLRCVGLKRAPAEGDSWICAACTDQSKRR